MYGHTTFVDVSLSFLMSEVSVMMSPFSVQIQVTCSLYIPGELG